MIKRNIFPGNEVWIHVNNCSFWVLEGLTYTYGYIENNILKYKTLQLQPESIPCLDKENFVCKCMAM